MIKPQIYQSVLDRIKQGYRINEAIDDVVGEDGAYFKELLTEHQWNGLKHAKKSNLLMHPAREPKMPQSRLPIPQAKFDKLLEFVKCGDTIQRACDRLKIDSRVIWHECGRLERAELRIATYLRATHYSTVKMSKLGGFTGDPNIINELEILLAHDRSMDGLSDNLFHCRFNGSGVYHSSPIPDYLFVEGGRKLSKRELVKKRADEKELARLEAIKADKQKIADFKEYVAAKSKPGANVNVLTRQFYQKYDQKVGEVLDEEEIKARAKAQKKRELDEKKKFDIIRRVEAERLASEYSICELIRKHYPMLNSVMVLPDDEFIAKIDGGYEQFHKVMIQYFQRRPRVSIGVRYNIGKDMISYAVVNIIKNIVQLCSVDKVGESYSRINMEYSVLRQYISKFDKTTLAAQQHPEGSLGECLKILDALPEIFTTHDFVYIGWYQFGVPQSRCDEYLKELVKGKYIGKTKNVKNTYHKNNHQ